MKKIMIAVALLVAGSSLESKVNAGVKTEVSAPKWKKSKTGTWAGKEGVWYKLNTKDASVWWSKDGNDWAMSEEGTWQDKEGKWLKIGDNKLWWSKDGSSWAEVPEWTWEGTDGKWYKFDDKWTLWVAM